MWNFIKRFAKSRNTTSILDPESMELVTLSRKESTCIFVRQDRPFLKPCRVSSTSWLFSRWRTIWSLIKDSKTGISRNNQKKSRFAAVCLKRWFFQLCYNCAQLTSLSRRLTGKLFQICGPAVATVRAVVTYKTLQWHKTEVSTITASHYRILYTYYPTVCFKYCYCCFKCS